MRSRFGSMYLIDMQAHATHSCMYATIRVGTALAVSLVHSSEDLSVRPFPSDGILIMDSCAYIEGPLHWTAYVVELLLYVYSTTGQRCTAVCQGGLTFVKYSQRITYMDLLESITSSFACPKFMVWIALGNDIYPPTPNMRLYETQFIKALHVFLTSAISFYSEQRIVFGATSEV